VTARAGGCCEYCRTQARFSSDSLSVEHVCPRSDGGATEFGNLALSCQGCNNRKYTSTEAVDPISGVTAPLFHPRLHRWSEHFTWSENAERIVGLTPTGRATVEKLQLNRNGLVNLRGVLYAAGKHPPVD
jgi:5-methylcytosine-specific restriction endonuclease McrA